MRLSPRAVGLTAAVVTVLIWTFFVVVARASAAHALTPLDITAARTAGAALVLLPWGFWLVRRQGLRGWLGLSPLPFRLTALIGLFGGLLFGVLVYSGFFFAPAAHASVLLPGGLPLWTTLLALLLLGERITAARAAGLALILAGGLVVGGASMWQAVFSAAGDSQVWKGDLLFIAAAICWSVYSVLVRRHGIDAVKAIIATMVFAAITYLPCYALLTASGLLASGIGQAPWGEVVFQMLFQGVGSVVLSGIGFMLMVQHFGPVRSTMITALVPGLSAMAAVLLLGEPLRWNLLVGLALVSLGIVLGVRAVPLRQPVRAVATAAATPTGT